MSDCGVNESLSDFHCWSKPRFPVPLTMDSTSEVENLISGFPVYLISNV